MKIQGIELKYGFVNAAKYDEFAKIHNHRSLQMIIYSVGAEHKRLEKKFKKKFDKLNNEQKGEHVLDINTGEIISMFAAFGGTEWVKAGELLDKETEQNKVILPEISAIMITDLFKSSLYTTLKAKAENPKKPK